MNFKQIIQQWNNMQKHGAEITLINEALCKLNDDNMDKEVEIQELRTISESCLEAYDLLNADLKDLNADVGLLFETEEESTETPSQTPSEGSSVETETFVVAVYGSLRKTMSNHAFYLGQAKFIGSAQTGVNDWEMYSLGGFPFITPCQTGQGHTCGSVKVELYEVNKRQMAALDNLEGYPSHYQRRQVTVKMDVSGNNKTCYIYYYPSTKACNKDRRVVNGDWVEYKNNKNVTPITPMKLVESEEQQVTSLLKKMFPLLDEDSTFFKQALPWAVNARKEMLEEVDGK